MTTLPDIKSSHLFDHSPLPLVIEPDRSGVDLIEWISHSEAVQYVQSRVLEVGGVLFRGFRDMASTERFRAFCASFPHPLLDYTEQSSPRERLEDKVYSSTTYPPDQYIPFHNANSFGHEFPLNIWFSCIRNGDEGGRTPICDTRQVLRNLSAPTRELFRDKGILYVRNYYRGMGVPWQETFATEDPAEVERFCRAGKIAFAWGEPGDKLILATRQKRHAIIEHPKTGDELWFNQVHLFHKRSMDKRLAPLLRQFSDDQLPRHSYFGDGTPIPDEVIDEVFDAYARAELSFDWREGDVMMLDNMLTSHARTPFKGDQRLISVAFSEMYDDYSAQFEKYGAATL